MDLKGIGDWPDWLNEPVSMDAKEYGFACHRVLCGIEAAYFNSLDVTLKPDAVDITDFGFTLMPVKFTHEIEKLLPSLFDLLKIDKIV